MITRTLFARAAASIILAGALVLGTSGCTFFTPQATLDQYDPADGVSADLGPIKVRNAVGIINTDGRAISLMVTIINTDSSAQKVDLQFTSGGQKTTVSKIIRQGGTSTFGTTTEDEQIVILNPDVPAGALLPVYVQWGTEPGAQMMVPVLEALGDYAELAPPEILR